MFDLHSITLTNFRSYLGTHEFEFPKAAGLYYFTGKNLSEPALGANGTGKSTFLDAITWCLYGLTTRKLKANEVLPWGMDASCSVTLKLTVGKQELEVTRTQKPNSLLLNDKPVDQTELETHIRLNFDSFLYSVINAQFGESFFSLTPSTKLTLFSDIMGLDFWLEKSQHAVARSTGLEFQLDSIQKVITINKALVESVNKDLELAEEASAAFHQNKKIRIALKTQELTLLLDKAISLDEKLADIKHENRAKLKNSEAMRDSYLYKIQQLSHERSECVGKIKAYKERYDEFDTLRGNCPICLQKVDQHHLDTKKNGLHHRIRVLETFNKTIDGDHQMFMKFMVKANNEIGRLTDEINEIKDRKAEINQLDAKIARLEVELDNLAIESDTWAPIISIKKTQLLNLENALSNDAKTFNDCQIDLAATQFWIKGFKRVRLFIIEQAFRTLEIEINNSLAQLGMIDWQISFDIERENKSGGITKGFVVFVKSPTNTEPVRWENWSGGETQRLQLAGSLGLANLIMHQHGLTNTIEMYDEPSTHLSPEGMLDLADMLHERAMSEDKRIWIVDHAAITNFGEFQATITAKKDENGSSITIDNG